MPCRIQYIQVDITILAINWNSGDCLERLLESLEDAAGDVSGIVVVDNASSDGSDECASRFSGVELERLESNIGFAAAVNRGFSRISNRYVLLVNPDIKFEDARETLLELYLVAENNPRAAIVTCPLFDIPADGGKSQAGFQFRPYPTLWNTLSDLLFIDELARLFKKGNEGIRGRELEPGVIELSGQPAAALWLARRSAWEASGGMDERFFPAWFEDVDFCLRLKKLGWKILFSEGPGKVFHKGGSSLDTLGFSGFLGHYNRNLLRFWRKHHPLSWPLVAVAVGVGYLARKALQLTIDD